jgi:type IV secretory pathway VirB3-like protein
MSPKTAVLCVPVCVCVMCVHGIVCVLTCLHINLYLYNFLTHQVLCFVFYTLIKDNRAYFLRLLKKRPQQVHICNPSAWETDRRITV